MCPLNESLLYLKFFLICLFCFPDLFLWKLIPIVWYCDLVIHIYTSFLMFFSMMVYHRLYFLIGG